MVRAVLTFVSFLFFNSQFVGLWYFHKIHKLLPLIFLLFKSTDSKIILSHYNQLGDRHRSPQSTHHTWSSMCSEDIPLLLRRGVCPGEYFQIQGCWGGSWFLWAWKEQQSQLLPLGGGGRTWWGAADERETSPAGLWREILSSLKSSGFLTLLWLNRCKPGWRRAPGLVAHSSGILLRPPLLSSPALLLAEIWKGKRLAFILELT